MLSSQTVICSTPINSQLFIELTQLLNSFEASIFGGERLLEGQITILKSLVKKSRIGFASLLYYFA